MPLGTAGDCVPNNNEAANSLVRTLCLSKRSISCAWVPYGSKLSSVPICMAGMSLLQPAVLLCQEIPCLVHQPSQFNS
jgi:hypothetical protein